MPSNDEEMLNDEGSILDALNSERIVSFMVTQRGVNITEGCDNYFSKTLSASQFSQLISELREIEAQLDRKKDPI
jgi:hypothetical protein